MQPRMFTEPQEERPKRVQLALRESDGNVHLQAVDSHGKKIASLMAFTEADVVPLSQAEHVLRDCGYDTTFAHWDEKGAIMLS